MLNHGDAGPRTPFSLAGVRETWFVCLVIYDGQVFWEADARTEVDL